MLKVFIITLLVLSLSNVKSDTVCDPSNRPTVCSADYVGVCAWFDKTVQCFAFPCAITTGNVCQGCKMTNVEKVTDGVCPPTGVISNSGSKVQLSFLGTMLLFLIYLIN